MGDESPDEYEELDEDEQDDDEQDGDYMDDDEQDDDEGDDSEQDDDEMDDDEQDGDYVDDDVITDYSPDDDEIEYDGDMMLRDELHHTSASALDPEMLDMMLDEYDFGILPEREDPSLVEPSEPPILDAMLNGNLTEQDRGREEFLMETLIGGAVSHQLQAVPALADVALSTVRGVRIACDRDVLDRGAPAYAIVDILRTNPLFERRPTRISTFLGIPLIVTVTVTLGQLMEDREGLMNGDGGHLYRPCNPEQEEFGYYTVWNAMMLSIGTVDIVRQDKKDITVKQVQALVHYVRHHIHEDYVDLTRVAHGNEEEQLLLQQRRHFVNTRLTRVAFENFFNIFKIGKSATDPSWSQVISPYET